MFNRLSAEKLSTKNSKLNNFLYGPFFPAYIAIICVASFTVNLPLAGLAIMAFCACILLIAYEDLTPFICLPVLVITLFRDVNDIVNVLSIVILLPVAICLVLHFILYPPKNFFHGKLTFPFISITIALFAGGLFSPYISEYGKAVVFSVATGPVLLFVYLLFRQYVKPPENFNLKSYICYILVIAGLVATAETAIHRYYFVGVLKIKGLAIDEMGWNNCNGVASLLLVCVAAGGYLLTKSKTVVPCFIAFILLNAGVFVTNSFGCIGVLIILSPVTAYYTIKKATKNGKKILPYLYLATLTIIIIGGGLYVAETGIEQALKSFYDNISHDHGRTALINEALELFIKYPIFGVSMGYVNPDTSLKVNTVIAYNFHSTPFHILATLGLFGLAAYVYYYAQRYKMLMQNGSAFNLFAFIGFTAFQAYGFIDTCEFNVIPCMLILTIFFAVLEYLNEKGNKTLPLKNSDYPLTPFCR